MSIASVKRSNRRAAELEAEAAKLGSKLAEFETKSAALQAARDEVDRRERELAGQTVAAAEAPPEQLQHLTEALAEARQTAAAATARASELSQTVDELQKSHQRLRESTELSEQRHGELQQQHELLQQQCQALRREASEQPSASRDWQTERRIADRPRGRRGAQAIADRSAGIRRRSAAIRIGHCRRARFETAECGAGRTVAVGPRKVERTSRGNGRRKIPPWIGKRPSAACSQSLEADSDLDSEPGRSEERLTVESTIQITDEIVAQKDREIAELRMHLSQQSSNIGAVAVGAAAIAESSIGMS